MAALPTPIERAKRVLRSIRQSIPSGVVLGRRSPGLGPAEFIPLDEITTAQLDAISAVQGSVLYRGPAAWQALAPGTAGHFLQTQGPSANPQWAAASGGGGGSITTSLAYRSSDQAMNNTDDIAEWTDVDHDDLNVFDLMTSDTRLTIPSALNGERVKLTAHTYWSSFSTGQRLRTFFMKNGTADFRGNGYTTISTNASDPGGLTQTAWLEVATGDYFEVRVFSQDSSKSLVGNSNFTWYQIEALV